MRRLTHGIPVLLTAALVAVVLSGQGATRTAESVTCSSTTRPPGGINLTGNWKSNDRKVYSLFQKGSCLWWVGGSERSNVFFGTVFGRTVTGIWTNVSSHSFDGLTLVIASRRKLVRRGSAGGFRPTRLTR
jgi:hypothetical protein